MTQSDKAFARAFGGVLAILVLITIGVAIAANSIPNPVRDARDSDPRLTELTNARIAPLAKVNTGEPMIAAATPAHSGSAAGASAEPRGGEEVYNLACGACHSSGLMGSPKLGDKAVWATRYEQGLAMLVSNAIGGIGSMPAKGGNPTISDAEVEAAVKHMLAASGQ